MRLGLLVSLLAICMQLVGWSGLRGMDFSNARLKTVYEDRTVALGQLTRIQDASHQIRAALLKLLLLLLLLLGRGSDVGP